MLIYPAMYSGHGPKKQTIASAQMLAIQTACSLYRNEFARFPFGDSFDIGLMLTGHNPKEKVFLDPDDISTNGEGALLDPWGTPYQIQLAPDKLPFIESAGKDGRWGTKDDLPKR